MSQTDYVMLAYAVALPAMIALVWLSWRAMRTAEGALEEASRKGKE